MTPTPIPASTSLLPNDRQRHIIIGATGSGKTVGALGHLRLRNFHVQPWVIYNYKRDENIDGIPYIRELPLDQIPTRPGVYVVHPFPDEESDELVENQLKAIWAVGGIGVYVDEGYMIPRNSRGFRMLLTQGRSKRIPMIVLSQRPLWMDRFVFSEGEVYQSFRLQHEDDERAAAKFIRGANFDRRLPEYHSWYYHTPSDRLVIMGPAPDMRSIHQTFERRLGEIERSQKRRLVAV